jgi:hypothetical protein
MGLHERHAPQTRHSALRSAVKTLQSIPEFADVQVQVADGTEQIRKSMAADAPNRGSDARMEHLVQMFDVYGGEYLRLVCDLETQKAYEIILAEYFCRAWEDFTGFGFESIRPYGNKSEPLTDRIRNWTMEGYRKIASLSRKVEGPPEDSTQTEQAERSMSERLAVDRKARIDRERVNSEALRILSQAAGTNRTHAEQARATIKGWQAGQIPRLNNAEAARRLGISETVLAALKRGNKPSAKTGKRCGLERVRLVAQQIGCRPEQLDAEYLNPVK